MTNVRSLFFSAINGILAMPSFKTQFGANCRSTTTSDSSTSICPKDAALIVAILSAGTAVGALLSAPAGDSLGRRISLLIAVGIFCIGAICQVTASEVVLLLIGRYVLYSSLNNIILFYFFQHTNSYTERWPVLVLGPSPFWYHYTSQKWRRNGFVEH